MLARIAPGSVLARRFHIAKLVGQGGMGAVYKAIDLRCDQPVAIKITPARDATLFARCLAREADVLAQLEHPGIVRYVTHGTLEDGSFYLAMQWLEGLDLQQLIRQGMLDEQQTIGIGLQICDALAAVHRMDIVHRDLKPANLIALDGHLEHITLIDFGLVHTRGATSDISTMGTLVGTPNFMAPEQARGEPHIDMRADLYSLGAVLFACLTQQPPCTGVNVMAVLAKLLLETPPRVRELRADVSPELDALIARLLDKEPDIRPATVSEVAWLLSELRATERCTAWARMPAAPPVSEIEQSFLSVLLVELPAAHRGRQRSAELAERARHYGGTLHRLIDGTLLAAFSASSDAAQMATMAARCAMDLRARTPAASMVLASGRGLLDRRVPVGEVIDCAAEMMFGRADTVAVNSSPAAVSRPAIVVDDMTAGLLQSRFELAPLAGGGHALLAESTTPRGARMLLGRESQCVGRARELTALEALFDECVYQSRPRLAVMTGPAGMGKSRIAHELVHRLHGRGERLAVWTAHGDIMRSGTPFGLLGQLIIQAIGIAPTASQVEVRRALQRRMAKLARHLPAAEAERCAVFLGEIIGVPFPDEGRVQLQEARRDLRLMQDQLHRAWQDWLDAETSMQPVLCVLDDLHWGDSPTVRFIDSALRNLSARPLMIVALARPELEERFPAIWAARGKEQIQLRPLSPDACRDLASQVVPGDLSEATLDRLIERCGGNPFYLEEILRSVAAGAPDALPSTVLAMVGARLMLLSADERKVLRAASVFGRDFWLDGIAELTGEAAEQLALLLQALASKELILRRPASRLAGEIEYVFRHDLTREAAYATLPAADRARAHEHAGGWLEQRGEKSPIVLVEHYRRTGEPARALPWLHQAAQQALEADDLAAGIEYAEQAVGCGATGETLGQLLLLQAEAYNWRSEHAKAHRCGRDALRLLRPGSEPWAHAAHQVAWAAGELAAFDQVEALASELAAAMGGAPPLKHAIALAWCTAHLASGGQYRQANAIRARLDTVTPALAAAPSMAATLAHVDGYLALLAGKLDRALTCMAASARHWEAAGNRRSVGVAQCNVGEIWMLLGQYEHAERILRQLLGSSQRLEAEFLTEAAKGLLAQCLGRLGRLDEAAELLADNLARPDGSFLRYSARASLAESYALAGHTDIALEQAERMLADLARYPLVQAHVQAIRAWALRALERPDEAVAAAGEGMRILDQHGTLERGEAFLRLAYAEALRAAGQGVAARAAIARARELLLERAARIDNAEWRASFVERVAENRQILALARELA